MRSVSASGKPTRGQNRVDGESGGDEHREASPPKKRNSILRVGGYLLRYPWLFAVTLVFAVLMVVSTIMIPLEIRKVVNGLESMEGSGALWKGVFLIVAFYFAAEFFNSLRIMVNNTLEQKVLYDMRRDLHEKLLRLPISFFDARRSGEISSRVIEDVANVERALLDGTEIGVRSILMIGGISAILFTQQPFLATFVFLPVPVLLITGIFYAKKSRRVWRGVRDAAGDLNALLVEDIQGNRLITSFGIARREVRRFHERATSLRTQTLRAMFRWALYRPTTTFVTNLGVTSVFAIGGYMILSGTPDFSYGDLLQFFLFATLLYGPLEQLHGLNHMLSAGSSSGDRVFEILDEPDAITSPPDAVAYPTGIIGVEFRGVRFNYPERGTVIEDLNLVLEPGKVTALVGHTGAGKSTLANLAMRSYDVVEGAVLHNGIDIRRFDLESLHQGIGHVAQDPFLFEGTVRDNLLLARETAGEPELITALQNACAWEFVREFPYGLDTNIGEKGIRLSQGEKQRLTIARVLLRNPAFVILDEATASVDTITERKIQTALDNLTRDRTVLVIAHRLSTVRRADKIVVLEAGKIVETGDHADLLSRGGLYARLCSEQFETTI